MSQKKQELPGEALIWQSLNHSFCSYKSKVDTHNFCRHEMNVTGLCNKSACPLANNRYATIREEQGRCFLYEKEPDKLRCPAKMWKKTLLPKNYAKALAIVSAELEYYPKFLQHRTKQRLTRIHQYLIRMRKFALQTRPKVVPVFNQKAEKREDRKEQKALIAAKLNESVQKELLNRLKQGTYGDIYNFPSMQYNEALDEAAIEDLTPIMEKEDEDDQMVEFVEGDYFDDDDDDDLEEIPEKLPPVSTTKRRRTTDNKGEKNTKKRKEKRRVEIEYDDDEQVVAPLLA